MIIFTSHTNSQLPSLMQNAGRLRFTKFNFAEAMSVISGKIPPLACDYRARFIQELSALMPKENTGLWEEWLKINPGTTPAVALRRIVFGLSRDNTGLLVSILLSMYMTDREKADAAIAEGRLDGFVVTDRLATYLLTTGAAVFREAVCRIGRFRPILKLRSSMIGNRLDFEYLSEQLDILSDTNLGQNHADGILAFAEFLAKHDSITLENAEAGLFKFGKCRFGELSDPVRKLTGAIASKLEAPLSDDFAFHCWCVFNAEEINRMRKECRKRNHETVNVIAGELLKTAPANGSCLKVSENPFSWSNDGFPLEQPFRKWVPVSELAGNLLKRIFRDFNENLMLDADEAVARLESEDDFEDAFPALLWRDICLTKHGRPDVEFMSRFARRFPYSEKFEMIGTFLKDDGVRLLLVAAASGEWRYASFYSWLLSSDNYKASGQALSSIGSKEWLDGGNILLHTGHRSGLLTTNLPNLRKCPDIAEYDEAFLIAKPACISNPNRESMTAFCVDLCRACKEDRLKQANLRGIARAFGTDIPQEDLSAGLGGFAVLQLAASHAGNMHILVDAAVGLVRKLHPNALVKRAAQGSAIARSALNTCMVARIKGCMAVIGSTYWYRNGGFALHGSHIGNALAVRFYEAADMIAEKWGRDEQFENHLFAVSYGDRDADPIDLIFRENPDHYDTTAKLSVISRRIDLNRVLACATTQNNEGRFADLLLKHHPHSLDSCIGLESWLTWGGYHRYVNVLGKKEAGKFLPSFGAAMKNLDDEGRRALTVNVLDSGIFAKKKSKTEILRGVINGFNICHDQLFAYCSKTDAQEIIPKIRAANLRGFLSVHDIDPEVRHEIRDRISDSVPVAEILNDLTDRLATGFGLHSYRQLNANDARKDAEWGALLLVSTRKGVLEARKLRELPSETAARAVRDAVGILQAMGRRTEAAWLEILLAIGLHKCSLLAGVITMRGRNTESGRHFEDSYTPWELPKKRGGKRLIDAPNNCLKNIQRAILDNILAPLGQHECAHGFVIGRSITTNAAPHVGHEVLVNADVHRCFPSVNAKLVLGVLRRDLAGLFSDAAIGLICDICTKDGALPTGAPTSPQLLNRVLLVTDEVLDEAARKRGCVYTRYADDLTFSGDHGAVEMLAIAGSVLRRIGLELDPEKTNIFRKGRRQPVTGLVVNTQVSVPRTYRRNLRAAVHAFTCGRTPTWHGRPVSLESIIGRINFLGCVHHEEAEALRRMLGENRCMSGE